MPLQAELVEQRLLRQPPLAHHLAALRKCDWIRTSNRSNGDFFNGIGRDRTKARREFISLLGASEVSRPL